MPDSLSASLPVYPVPRFAPAGFFRFACYRHGAVPARTKAWRARWNFQRKRLRSRFEFA